MIDKMIRSLVRIMLFLVPFLLMNGRTKAQTFYFGNDLSYVNQMEDCGAVFKEKMQPKDIYRIFADHGTNLVRVRLWIDPSWWQAPLSQPEGVKSYYNDIEDVKETIQRARSAGMQVMLDLHYSDFWADPGRQLIPRKWINFAYDLTRMKDSVYTYTLNTLMDLDHEGLMPEIVKVGNETNPGILKDIPTEGGYGISATVSNSWARHGVLFNSAIKAIREAGAISSINPKIAVHFTGTLSSQVYNFRNLIDNGKVTDFDIIGISYYYAWHKGSISQLESTVKSLSTTFPAYKTMVVETGYLWSTQNYDQLGNIVSIPDPEYLPVGPPKQLEYMVDYTRAVMRGGGIGVVFWEPAWVSTPCRTPWGQGSSHDHLVFFDPVHTNFMENGGGRWMESPFYTDLTTQKLTLKVDMKGQDTTNGVYISGSFSGSPWEILPMSGEGNGIFTWWTFVKPGEEGGYYFLNDKNFAARETVPDACAGYQDSTRRYRIFNLPRSYGYKWGSCESILGENPDEIQVTFAVNMARQDVSRGVYITGHLTGDPWKIIKMTAQNDSIFFYNVILSPGQSGAFYFLTTSTWTDYLKYRETVPAACATWWNSDRGYIVPVHDTVIAVNWGSCNSFEYSTLVNDVGNNFRIGVFPNPAAETLTVRMDAGTENPVRLELLDLLGRTVQAMTYPGDLFSDSLQMDVSIVPSGLYVLRLLFHSFTLFRKIVIK